MSYSYSRSGYTSTYVPRSTRERDTSRSTYSSLSSSSRTYRSSEPAAEKVARKRDEDDSMSSEEDYSTLRSQLRTLQREVSNSAHQLESVTREKEELTVALSHAKRDRSKVTAEAEAIEVERDSLERENRRIKAKLESSAKELRELNEERRELSEKLRASDGTLQLTHFLTLQACRGVTLCHPNFLLAFPPPYYRHTSPNMLTF